MQNANLKAISVVIPSWNGASHLERALPSILAQKNITYEVIVVENGIVNDDTLNLISKLQHNHANLKLHRLEQNCGYAGGVNAGVQIAQYSLVAVVCNDNIAEPNWLHQLLQAYDNGIYKKTGKKIAAIMSQSKLVNMDTNLRGNLNFCGRNITYPDDAWLNEPVPIFYPGGNAFLFDKILVGLPFDPFYFTYQEDVALGWRLRNLGYEIIYNHRSIVNSFDGGTTKKTPYRTSFYSERNRLINLYIFPELKTILKLHIFWKLDYLASLFFGSNRIAKFHAALWILRHPLKVLALRKKQQQERKVSDHIALQALSGKYFSENQNTGFSMVIKKKINHFFEILLH